jgi:hypothetical protein
MKTKTTIPIRTKDEDGNYPRARFSAMWSDDLGAEILARSLSTDYAMEFHAGSGEMTALAAAVNQGIDAHLEAVFFTEFPGRHGRRGFRIHAGSLPCLVRRLLDAPWPEDETEENHAASLASGICETLNIELI